MLAWQLFNKGTQIFWYLNNHASIVWSVFMMIQTFIKFSTCTLYMQFKLQLILQKFFLEGIVEGIVVFHWKFEFPAIQYCVCYHATAWIFAVCIYAGWIQVCLQQQEVHCDKSGNVVIWLVPLIHFLPLQIIKWSLIGIRAPWIYIHARKQ